MGAGCAGFTIDGMNQARNRPFAGRTDVELAAQIEWVERRLEGLRREHAAMVAELGRRRSSDGSLMVQGFIGFDDPSLMTRPAGVARRRLRIELETERQYAARARAYGLRVTMWAMAWAGVIGAIAAMCAWRWT